MGIVETLASLVDDKFLDYSRWLDGSTKFEYRAFIKVHDSESHFLKVHSSADIGQHLDHLYRTDKIRFQALLQDCRRKFCALLLQNYYFGDITVQGLSNSEKELVQKDSNYCDEDDITTIVRYSLLVNRVCTFE